jgi:flagellar basal-body rod protein FlgC
MVDAINIALSGLQLNTERVRVGANNIVNAGTVGALDGADGPAPYTPQDVIATANAAGGVQSRVIDRKPAYVPGFDPNSSYSNEDGLVGVPNVDLADETVRMKMAEISYRASLKVIQTAEKMQDALLQSFDERV